MLNRNTDELILTRINESKNQTQGILQINGKGKMYVTLELPYRNNQKNISCIPKGNYKVVKRYSNKFSYHFHVQNVENRELILIHYGNYNNQTRGCILVGENFKDLNNDNEIDITNSKNTMLELLTRMPKEFNLKIK